MELQEGGRGEGKGVGWGGGRREREGGEGGTKVVANRWQHGSLSLREY